ncbi:MAG: hypothetical protein J6X99_05250 [Bacteroidales bacterium]|nr:hypothetical protein [Bacteroidales bacterium]
MRLSRKLLGLVAVCLMTASCLTSSRADKKTQALLDELDGYLTLREAYAAKKQNQLDVYRNLALATTDPARRYELEMITAQEYFSFSFDSTQFYLKNCQALAARMADRDRYNQATIMLGHLYDKAGNYLEATQILYSQIDTNSLSEELKADYFWTLYEYSKDMAGNSGMVERMSIPPAASFRSRLYQLLPPSSARYLTLLRDQYTDEGKLEKADSISTMLVESVKPEDRDFAIHSFFQSELANMKGDQASRMYWLVKSAECDLINAVRDYASLTMVAQLILPTDVDRSFRYLRIAQEDALSYNAKLRPWQISRFLMDVEDAYQARQDRVTRSGQIWSIVLAALTLLLSIVTYFLIARSRKLNKARSDLETSNTSLAQANAALSVLNEQISQSARVKEKYIVNFLQGLSSQISVIRTEDNRFRNLLKQGKADQLLKELSISGRSEKARDEFYETFDNTFLALYPDFVNQFNALLKEEARVVPPEGKLTTEQRVFALILLGVDDSKKIASMLDYSVSTIYNYKVSIKNAALGDRETLEERVKELAK